MGYLGDNFHVNFIHTHDKREFTTKLKRSNGVILNPGDFIKKKQQ